MALRGTEPKRPSDVLKRHDPEYSLEERTALAGSGIIQIGQVMGTVTVGAATAAAKAGGNTGNGTISAVTRLGDAKTGVYSVRFTAATAFTLRDPNGDVVDTGSTGVAFANDLGFTINAGATPFSAGDGYDITVALGSRKLRPFDPTAVDGSQVPTEISIGRADATSADAKILTVAREATVLRNELVWGVGVNAAQQAAALLVLERAGIIAAQGA